MQPDWASDNLQVIRTLMERSAIYRRALAPMMFLAGGLGTAAAALGLALPITAPDSFVVYWLAIGTLALLGAAALVRGQALRAAEPLWSPPMRRVVRAGAPGLVAGTVAGFTTWGALREIANPETAALVGTTLLPLAWIVLYGCSFHAAGFFMPRGIRLFGWVFVLAGCAGFAAAALRWPLSLGGHPLMGLFFGVLHLAYGGYLRWTERGTNAA